MTAEEKLLEFGYDPDEINLFKNEDYDSALVGVSEDGRAIYDFDLMIEDLVNKYGWSDIEAVEWIETNTLRAVPYFEPAPIVMYKFPDVD